MNKEDMTIKQLREHLNTSDNLTQEEISDWGRDLEQRRAELDRESEYCDKEGIKREAPASTWTKIQGKIFKKKIGEDRQLIIKWSYDDEYGHGHNMFTIEAEVRSSGFRTPYWRLHDLLSLHRPDLKHCIKWDSVSSNGPMHYLKNAEFWRKQIGVEPASERALDCFKSAIVYGVLGSDFEKACAENLSQHDLMERLPALMWKFKEFIEGLGFVY